MKIAIIGSGISGNVAAYHLAKTHEVTVFEAGDHIGGHTDTHDILWAGQHYEIDTGFIVFNGNTYPNFINLLENLDVSYQQTEMSFSVKHDVTGLEYNGHTLNTLFAQRKNLFSPSFHRMIRDILRFNRNATEDLNSGNLGCTLGHYLEQGGFSAEFIHHYILPMGAAIWSMDTESMRQFPAKFFIRFFTHHGLLQVNNRPPWYVVNGGSRSYVKKLVSGFSSRIKLNQAVESVRRLPTHVEIKCRNSPTERFDAVFIATHSDQALEMLESPSKMERDVLGAIRYQPNDVVLHTDTSILPKRKLAWASWNYHIPADKRSAVAVTYNMNILQKIKAPVEFCVTLNNTEAVNEKSIIKRLTYDHPVFTEEALSAQQKHHLVNGRQRTFYCGAYWRNGFHEDGVVSALTALDHFGKWENEQQDLRRAG